MYTQLPTYSVTQYLSHLLTPLLPDRLSLIRLFIQSITHFLTDILPDLQSNYLLQHFYLKFLCALAYYDLVKRYIFYSKQYSF
jgi:hypothetical protein